MQIKERKGSTIESLPLSILILAISSGENYPLAIAKELKRNDSSPILKQLNQLEKEKFVKSRQEALLNKRIYSVCWNKIIEEFIYYAKKKNDYLLTQEKILKPKYSEGYKHKLESLKLLENKEFILSIKENKLLQEYFEIVFSLIFKIYPTYTISSIFEYILNNSNFRSTLDFLIAVTNSHQKRYIENNSELRELSILQSLIDSLKFDLILQLALDTSQDCFEKEVLDKYFTEEEKEHYYKHLESFERGGIKTNPEGESGLKKLRSSKEGYLNLISKGLEKKNILNEK